MTTKEWIVGALLHLYPAQWRQEYGPELSDILLSQPLRARIVVDVLGGGLRQRLRVAPPWAILGSGALAYIIAELYTYGVVGTIRPSGITFPTYRVASMDTNLYALLLMVCGAWTELQHASRGSSPGWSAVKLSMLAGSPVVIAGLLSASGVPAGTPSALEVTAAPVSMLALHWIYGYLGGHLGGTLRSFGRWFRSRVAHTR
jgi:hypothetical protein